MPYSAGISGASSKLYLTPGQSATGTLVSTSSFNGSGGANRFPELNRNDFQSPKTWVLDLRASKRIMFHDRYGLEFLAEGFNLTNHQNVTSVGNTAYVVAQDKANLINTLVPYTSTAFRSITGTNNSNFAFNVRQLQLAVRLSF